MRMLRDLVLIKPIEKPSVTPAGIVLPHNQHRPWVKGDDECCYQVVAAGPKSNPEIQPGVRVLADVSLDIKHTFDDHSGRLIVKSEQIRMIW